MKNICSSSGGAQEELKDRMKLILLPKLVEKLVWVPVISFRIKIFIPSYVFDALLCWNWPFSPPNRVTQRITPLFRIWGGSWEWKSWNWPFSPPNRVTQRITLLFRIWGKELGVEEKEEVEEQSWYASMERVIKTWIVMNTQCGVISTVSLSLKGPL